MDPALLADLAAENEALDRLLAEADASDWARPTPAAGWVVADQVHHLTRGNLLAVASVRHEPGTAFDAEPSGPPPPRPDIPAVLLTSWRESCHAVVDAFAGVDPRERVVWGRGTMAARTLATARLMEAWAHGLDCHAAVGVEPVDTDRLRHVAHLAHRALPHAFSVAGEEPPGSLERLALDLSGPTGDRWWYGPDSPDEVVAGPAGEWCRVAVRRVPAAATSLAPSGPLAAAALRVARAYV